MTETLFEKIAQGKIPSKKVFEDDLCLAIEDINPVAPVHVIVFAKKLDGLDRLNNAKEKHEKILGHLLAVVPQVAKAKNIGEEGYRVVINDGTHGGQTVPHLHLHVIGGQQLGWPPGVGGLTKM